MQFVKINASVCIGSTYPLENFEWVVSTLYSTGPPASADKLCYGVVINFGFTFSRQITKRKVETKEYFLIHRTTPSGKMGMINLNAFPRVFT